MKTKLLANIFRWTARVIGIVLVGMALCVALFTPVPNPFSLPFDRMTAFLTFTLVLLAFLLAWRWEFLGGIISLLGCIVFITIESTLFRDTLFFIVLAVPGPLFLASTLLRHYETHKSASYEGSSVKH